MKNVAISFFTIVAGVAVTISGGITLLNLITLWLIIAGLILARWHIHRLEG
ncbi:hypothetical protein LCGC14_0801740 [marine sediment metagenome]|uniref:Uncharacterized protein n=1 Tax=marine sediment metagenome TaxID=412755 RepID=A0A0F9S9E0_9ZZZZ